MTDVAWTDQRVALLRNLWGDGLSASQIADELGGVTRNAIIGKLHRLGLTGSDGGSKTPSSHPRKAHAQRRVPFRPSATEAQPPDELPPIAIEDMEIPLEQRRMLLQLTEKTCRWPVGETGSPEFFFCGAAANNSAHPYCTYHHRIGCAGAPKGMPRTNSFTTFR